MWTVQNHELSLLWPSCFNNFTCRLIVFRNILCHATHRPPGLPYVLHSPRTDLLVCRTHCTRHTQTSWFAVRTSCCILVTRNHTPTTRIYVTSRAEKQILPPASGYHCYDVVHFSDCCCVLALVLCDYIALNKTMVPHQSHTMLVFSLKQKINTRGVRIGL